MNRGRGSQHELREMARRQRRARKLELRKGREKNKAKPPAQSATLR